MFKTDCRFYKGYLPCKYHKLEKAVLACGSCGRYDKISKRILIIKLGARGDVLRTTAILPALKNKYPKSYIVWLTKDESIAIFENNSLIDRVLRYGWETIAGLFAQKYDLVINLDCENTSAQIASLIKANEKLGYGYDEKGFIKPFNKETRPVLDMSLSDSLKKRNKKTYQEMIFNICKLKYSKDCLPVFRLTPAEISKASKFAEKNRINGKIVIGLVPGSSDRWSLKRWPARNYVKLAKRITGVHKNSKILLFGTQHEAQILEYISENSGKNVINTGSDNSLRDFAALLNLCGLVITGDTLALHLAAALKKEIAVLFGPTSHNEIELYGLGKKIYSDMENISVEEVFHAVKERI